MADDILFGIKVNIGSSVEDIKAVNRALSDFGRNSLIASKNAETSWSKFQQMTKKSVFTDFKSNSANPFASWAEGMRGTEGAFKSLNNETDKSKNLFKSFFDFKGDFKSVIQGTRDWTDTSASLRYALYDVSSATALAAASMAAFPIAAAAGAIKAERAFADVKRTLGISGAEADNLKNQFIELSQALPITFNEVSAIGSLAGQLGIASDQTANFTENVIKFSTVTNMTSEASATALARLNDLIPGVSGNYEALSSAILKVGVNSAATESEIVAVAQQIAPVANTFNFSADAVIGFAGAMASLKIPPELSRGMLQRTFAIVNQAISSNSSDLDKWGAVIGKSGAEFKAAWLDNSVMTFADTLRAIGNQGGAAEGTLVGLGITASRDAATIKRLAQNVDSTLIPALNNASSGYNASNEQQKQFDEIAKTLGERINKLASNFQNFINAAGSGVSAFGGLIDAASGFLGWMTDIINNPFGRWFFGMIGGMTAFSSILLVIVSVAARFRAGIIAINQAIVGTKAHFAAVREEAMATGASLRGLSGIATATGLSFKALGLAMKSTLIGLGISLAVSALAAMFEGLAASTQSADDKITAMFGSTQELSAAMAEDARAAKISGENVLSYSDFLTTAGKRIDENGNLINSETAARDSNAQAIAGQTTALGNYSVAIGKATKQKIADKIFSSDEFKKIDEWNKRMGELGQSTLKIDMTKVLDFSAAGDMTGLNNYMQQIKDAAYASLHNGDANSLGMYWNDQWILSDTTAQKIESSFGAIKTVGETAINAVGAAGNQVFTNWVNGTNTATGSTEEWAMSISDVESGIKQINDSVSQGFQLSNVIGSAADNFQKLIQGIVDGSNSFNLFSEAGRTNVSNFQSATSSIISMAYAMGVGAGDAVNILYQQLQASGVNAAEIQLQLNGLVQAGVISASTMAQIIGGTFQMSAKGKQLQDAFSGIANSARSAAKSTGEVAKQVRTLVDLANDFSSVWKRAFDIRFGNQDAMDKISEGWRRISEDSKKATDDMQHAQDTIKQINADTQQLSADKKLKEYWLSIAAAAGDAVRVAQLQAEIADIDAKMASKRTDLANANQDLTDAQQANNKTLVGNSKAAIANRTAVRGMVTNYQEYIQSLISSGASQATVNQAIADSKQDFINQGLAAGYSRTELDKYTQAFTDMKTIVKSTSVGLTVKISVDPANTAISEWKSRAQSSLNTSKFSAPTVTLGLNLDKNAWNSQVNKAKAYMQYWTEWQGIESKAKKTQADINRMWSLKWYIGQLGYAQGGYTGAGGMYQPAGIVHKGEYVVPKSQVNQQTGLPYYMSQPRSFAAGGFVGQQSSMVYLSPEDRALLRNIGGSGEVVLYANNEALARSVNAGNKSIVAAGGRP